MIDPHLLFSLSGPIAMLGWLALMLAPAMPRISNTLATLVIPTLFSIAYAALIMALRQVLRLRFNPVPGA